MSTGFDFYVWVCVCVCVCEREREILGWKGEINLGCI